jgi:hypothetical protein
MLEPVGRPPRADPTVAPFGVRPRADILAQIECFAYNKRTISSHVTGEKTIPPPMQEIAAGIGKRWASTGKREISSAVRLGSPNGKYD